VYIVALGCLAAVVVEKWAMGNDGHLIVNVACID